MLNVQNLTYAYPDTDRPALKNISFAMDKGQVLVVAGATESGKSTLCYALAGFVPHFFNGEIDGDIALGGRSMRQSTLGDWVQDVGLVLQNPFNQISGARSTVFEEVAFGLENLGVPREEMRGRVQEVLEQLDIAPLAQRSPYALSGGQQQRVAIASVLAMRPELLVLDEPTAQLDPDGTAEVLAVIHRLAQSGTTVVLATHQLAEVAPFATHALVLHNGEVVSFGAAGEVLRDTKLAQWEVEPPLYVSVAAALGRPQPLPLTVEEFTIVSVPVTTPQPPPTYYPFTLTTSSEAHTVPSVAATPVVIEHISFAYPSGVAALQDVTLTLEPATITAIIGANGAGKSTLSRTINGLLRPQKGTIQVGDWNVTQHKTSDLARKVGYLFQNPDDQLFKPKVWDEVAFGPQNLGGTDETVKAAVEQALRLTGLTNVADSHPYDLHATTRRWVALASVLALGAPVVILDEPTSGFDLDDKTRMAALCRTLRQAGYTVVIVSHDMQLVAEVADKVVVIGGGKVVAADTPATVFGDDALLSQVDGILPPIVKLARAFDLPRTVVTARQFVESFNHP